MAEWDSKGDSPTEIGLGDLPTVTPNDSDETERGRAEALIGQVLDDKYEIVELLGEGGMGAVYEALHTTIGSRVAVKVLHPEAARQPESLERFRREAQVAGTIGHPNIVRVHDIGQTPSPNRVPYMVMDFVEGRSLAEVLYREAPIEPRRAANIATQILSALGAAHAKGVVHRDIKPENVLVLPEPDGSEVARVLDFGISKFRELGPDRQGLTRTGTILGTPLFMAPEQARGETDIDHRIDLYAVGVTLYVMITGEQPYRASNYNALIVKILTEAPPPLAELMPELDPALVSVIGKAMARERDDRFGSAEEFIDALQGRVVVESPPDVPTAAAAPTEPPLPPPARRTGLWIGLAALVVIIVAGAGAFAIWAGDRVGDEGQEQATVTPSIVDAGRQTAASEDTMGAVEGSGDADVEGDSASASDGSVEVVGELMWLEIKTQPRNARIRFNGRVVANPAKESFPLDDNDTVFVQISAPGYHDFETTYPRVKSIDETIRLDRRRAKVVPRTDNGMVIKTGR